MELIENLLQLLVTFAGACLAGFAYWKSRAQKYFLLFCFYGCFALGALCNGVFEAAGECHMGYLVRFAALLRLLYSANNAAACFMSTFWLDFVPPPNRMIRRLPSCTR